jgi:hypothetical protein
VVQEAKGREFMDLVGIRSWTSHLLGLVQGFIRWYKRRRLGREFMDLVQGGMTVTEYATRFI